MVLSRDEFPAKVKAELKEALAYFIERQKLVAQAIPFLKTKKLRSRRTQRAGDSARHPVFIGGWRNPPSA